MQGLHLTADLYDCTCDPRLLSDDTALSALCRTLTSSTGLTLVDEKWHTFPASQGQHGGVTGMLLLAESHLAVHTWPEKQGVTLDVYVCNFTADNSEKADRLMHALIVAFAPGRAQSNRLHRGEEEELVDRGELLLEPLNESSSYGFRFARRLLSKKTAYQHLELLESPSLGRTLRLDGRFMTAEAEEFFYHEAIVHPAAIAHPGPRTVLVIGGGDGGAVEELLKHVTVEEVTLVELDAEVIEVARTYLRSIHRGALDDPRVKLHIENGVDFVQRAEQRFDLVLLDLTDPETPAGPLYTPDFFRCCQRLLTSTGGIVLHLGAPFFEPERVRQIAAALSSVFSRVRAYGLHIPLYGAYWALAVASEGREGLDPCALTPAHVRQRLEERRIADLQYYNPEVHPALFALPNFYRGLLPN